MNHILYIHWHILYTAQNTCGKCIMLQSTWSILLQSIWNEYYKYIHYKMTVKLGLPWHMRTWTGSGGAEGAVTPIKQGLSPVDCCSPCCDVTVKWCWSVLSSAQAWVSCSWETSNNPLCRSPLSTPLVGSKGREVTVLRGTFILSPRSKPPPSEAVYRHAQDADGALWKG